MADSFGHTIKMPRAPDKAPRPTLGRSVPPMHEYEGQPCGFSSVTGTFALLGLSTSARILLPPHLSAAPHDHD